MAKASKPNILILWGDDIGWWNISYNNRGQMGYRTPNIDRIGHEGALSPTITASKVARPGALRSSPGRTQSALA